MTALRTCYPEIDPCASGYLELGGALSQPGIRHHLIEATDRFAGSEY